VLPKASFCQRTVLGLLQAYQQQVRRYRYPGSQQPVPVHRLGRGTSGEGHLTQHSNTQQPCTEQQPRQ
jgi:23S rRNA-/tRNA-specific pseudouridylate synthase